VPKEVMGMQEEAALHETNLRTHGLDFYNWAIKIDWRNLEFHSCTSFIFISYYLFQFFKDS